MGLTFCLKLFPSQDPSVILEETDQDQVMEDTNEKGDEEPVAIHVDSVKDGSSCSPTGRNLLDIEEEFKGYTMTRSHSMSSSSDISRVEGSASKHQEEAAKSLAAHSLTDMSKCGDPTCQIKNRSHRHSTPGRLCSYLRLCSVVDLPALGQNRVLAQSLITYPYRLQQDRHEAFLAQLSSVARPLLLT